MSNPRSISQVRAFVAALRHAQRRAMRDYLQLMRLPNIFTAIADVSMGFLFVKPLATFVDACTLAVLASASALLYIAGVVYNDVFDVDLDRVERPERPLPSGRIPVRIASRFAGKMLLWGIAAGALSMFFVLHMQTFLIASILAALILLYDTRLKHMPIGPLAMGGCRMLNVMLGMNVVHHSLPTAEWLVAGGVGVYVTGITWFARTENEQSSRRHLALASGVMLLGIAMLAWFPRWKPGVIPQLQAYPEQWYLLIGVLAAWIAARCLRAIISPTPEQVRFAVKQGILSLVLLDAAVCYAVRGPFSGMMVALLLLPAVAFGRWIEST